MSEEKLDKIISLLEDMKEILEEKVDVEGIIKEATWQVALKLIKKERYHDAFLKVYNYQDLREKVIGQHLNTLVINRELEKLRS